jgi:hypothetical protein
LRTRTVTTLAIVVTDCTGTVRAISAALRTSLVITKRGALTKARPIRWFTIALSRQMLAAERWDALAEFVNQDATDTLETLFFARLRAFKTRRVLIRRGGS